MAVKEEKVMANELDETNPVINEAGRDVNVIDKQLPIKVGAGSLVFEIMLWVLGIIPGLIFLFVKITFVSLLGIMVPEVLPLVVFNS